MSNTPRETIHNITNNFGIPSTIDLGLYLGFPLIHGRMNSAIFQYIVDRVHWKLGGCQHKILSRVT